MQTTAPDRASLPACHAGRREVSTIAALAEIPEEDIWLAKQKSKRTRRAYKQDVQHFMRTLDIRSYDELRQVDHRAVIAWERIMRDSEKAASSTIRRRLAALSSLMKHLVRHGHLGKNHVAEVERPSINREQGTTLAFSKAQANKLLNAPAPDTIEGLQGSRNSVSRSSGGLPPRRDCLALRRRPASEPGIRLTARRPERRPARRARHSPANGAAAPRLSGEGRPRG
jgi:hypothetical protein